MACFAGSFLFLIRSLQNTAKAINTSSKPAATLTAMIIVVV